MRTYLLIGQRAVAAVLIVVLFGACSDDPGFFPFDPDAVVLQDGGDAVAPDGGEADALDTDSEDPDGVDSDADDTVEPDVVDPDTVDPDAGDTTVDPDAGDTTVDPDAADGGDVTDPCASGDLCAAIGVSCEGEQLVTCVPDADACLRPFRTDCLATPFGFCETTGAVAMCSVADPCVDLELCAAEARSCDDETLVVCAPNENGCLLEERTDCDTEERGFCDDSGDVLCDVAPDPCAELELCETAGVICEDDVRVSCTMNAFGCMVVDRINCGAAGNVCEAGSCESACGDGALGVDEDCDDANRANSDGCSIMCDIELGWRCDDSGPSVCEETACGDSILDPGEFCDDGDARSGDGCSAFCAVEAGYTCVGAPSACTLDPFCGDGTIDAGEFCDDGNRVGMDGCGSTCRVESGFTCTGEPSRCTRDSFCGDGNIDLFEDCDDMDRANGDGCSSVCLVEPGYTCTDEPSICMIPPSSCGNNSVEPALFEACDDGNRVSGDGCSADCGFELPTARSTFVEWDIEFADTTPTYRRQTSNCLTPTTDEPVYPYVGRLVTNTTSTTLSYSFAAQFEEDGYLLLYAPELDVDASIESCLIGDDDFAFGTATATGGSFIRAYTLAPGQSVVVMASTFASTPRLPFEGSVSVAIAGCGDGVRDSIAAEGCDDINTASGDGCSQLCQPESGFDCDTRSPTTCVDRSCGDGVTQEEDGEECDDGDTAINDGCDSACVIEDGWICERLSEPSECRFVACGDGAIDYEGGERCDDGLSESGDGCSSLCVVEPGYRCEGTPSACADRSNVCGDEVLALGEGCDGNALSPPEACAADCVVSLPATGTSLSLEGSVDGDDGVLRLPNFDCSAQTTDHFYDAYWFRNDTGARLEIDVSAFFDEELDASLRVFSGDLDPTAPAATCVAGDDDFPFFAPALPVVSDRIVSPGSVVVIVVSSPNELEAPSTYRLQVRSAACGDGELNVDELCDDGDVVSDDGCSATCQTEDGFVCTGEPSRCDGGICGDGFFENGEECDDSNVVTGDGCSAACEVEDGFLCDGAFPTLCERGACGDGIQSALAGETCDDGNLVISDGCSDGCELEAGGACNRATPQSCVLPVCGDDVSEAWETCDVADGILCQGCATPLGLFDTSFEFSGSIDDTDLVFSRPSASSGACTSSTTREVSYFDGWSYVNASASPVNVTISAQWDDGDGYLLLFNQDFDPQASFATCVWGDDDASIDGGTSTGGSQLEYELAAGESVVIVATTFNDDDPIGGYTITVDIE